MKVPEAIDGVGDTYYEGGFLYAPSTSVGPYTYTFFMNYLTFQMIPPGSTSR